MTDAFGPTTLPRRAAARAVRRQAADLAYLRRHHDHLGNGEEADHAPFLANYSKGLPHNALGEVRPQAYRELLRALLTGEPRDFNAIPLGSAEPSRRRLVNPQAGLTFTLEGPDAQALTMPPPPRIDEPQTSAEMAELYWMALLRDVEFVHYGTGAGTDAGPPTTAAAAASLENEFSEYQGPANPTGDVAQRLFRGVQPGCEVGPYVSQFLIKDIPFGSFLFVQRQQPPEEDTDFLTDFGEWLVVQNGSQPRPPGVAAPGNPIPLLCDGNGDPDRRYIRNLRDLSHLVHFDISYQHYFNACLLLLHMNRRPDQLFGPCRTSEFAPPCMSGPLDLGNPYLPQFSPNQEGFATFGNWHVPTLLAEVATRALWAVWYQKWFVHRRLRPEELGGRIQVQLREAPGRYDGLIDAEIRDSLQTGGLAPHFGDPGERFEQYLLPQAFPEGSPLHPSYGEGHATLAGACVTVLKAFYAGLYEFDPNSANPFERPEQVDPGGNTKSAFQGRLSVEGELNKLASNIGLGGRGGAGVHYRSDNTESLPLGEAIAIGLLQEHMLTFNERLPDGSPPSFALTRFDGRVARISAAGVTIGP